MFFSQVRACVRVGACEPVWKCFRITSITQRNTLRGRIKHEVEIYKRVPVLLMNERDSEYVKAKAYCKRKMKGWERRVKMREKKETREIGEKETKGDWQAQ